MNVLILCGLSLFKQNHSLFFICVFPNFPKNGLLFILCFSWSWGHVLSTDIGSFNPLIDAYLLNIAGARPGELSSF